MPPMAIRSRTTDGVKMPPVVTLRALSPRAPQQARFDDVAGEWDRAIRRGEVNILDEDVADSHDEPAGDRAGARVDADDAGDDGALQTRHDVGQLATVDARLKQVCSPRGTGTRRLILNAHVSSG